MVATAPNTIADLKHVNEQLAVLRTRLRNQRVAMAQTRQQINALLGRRSDLCQHHDARFLDNMRDEDYAHAVEDLIRGLPNGPQLATPNPDDEDDELDPDSDFITGDFAQHVADESAREAAEMAREQAPRIAADDGAAVHPRYVCTCRSCSKEFRTNLIVQHCPRCIAIAYQRATDDGPYAGGNPAEHDASA